MVSQLNLTTTVAGRHRTEKVVVEERFQQQAMYGLSAIKKGRCRDVAAVAERWPLIDVPLYVNLNTLC